MKVNYKELETSFVSLLILILLLFLALYVTSPKDPALLCEGDKACLLKLVKEERSARACSFAQEKEKCYYESSFYLKDPNLCYLSYEPEQCIFELSLFAGDEGYCEFSSHAEFCYYSYALGSSKGEICSLSGRYEESCLKRLIKS